MGVSQIFTEVRVAGSDELLWFFYSKLPVLTLLQEVVVQGFTHQTLNSTCLMFLMIVLICIFLMITDAKHPFNCLLAICMSLEKVLSPFLIGYYFFLEGSHV